MKALGRLFTAMITPFDANGAVDVPEAARIAQFLVDRGNDGVIVSGTTGEAPALETDEKLALFTEIKKKLGTSGTVVAGTTGNNTRHAVELTKLASQTGVDGILAVVPYYSKPPQDGMLAHFGAIAEATHLPVIVYNIPGRTGVNMLPETIHELARRYPNIAGVKESSGDVAQFTALVRDRVREDFTVWSGDDYFYLPSLALGAYGCISVAAHVCSRELRAMAEAYDGGDIETAGRIHRDLYALFTGIFAHASPIPIKWAMNEYGFKAGACRPPMGPLPDALKNTLRPLIAPYRPE
jgi:4-hydroxy-tetrahydrodipicolinate synthase